MKITYTVVTHDDQMNLVDRIKAEAGVEGEFLYFLKRFRPRAVPSHEAGPAFDVNGEEWIVEAGTGKIYKYANGAESDKDGWMLD